MRIDNFKLKPWGNIRSLLEVTINGVKIPEITIESERKSSTYNVLKWVRVDTGPKAKFIKAPTKMAQYVVETYLD